MSSIDTGRGIVILGIGNVLMGDEGVGVHVARWLQKMRLPEGVECLDGGAGGFQLLAPLQRASSIILIDATVDDAPKGMVRRLRPRFARDYPRTLAAHDIGLKELLDALCLLGGTLDVVLFAITVAPPLEMKTTLSPEIESLVPEVGHMVLAEVSARGHH